MKYEYKSSAPSIPFVVAGRPAVIVKPVENLSIYCRLPWSLIFQPPVTSFRRAVETATVILAPQKFEEHGSRQSKWNILPRLLYSAAIYDLKTDECFRWPTRATPDFFYPVRGATRIRGFRDRAEGLCGQTSGNRGSATPTPTARVTSNTSATIVAGNRNSARSAPSVLVVETSIRSPRVWAALTRRHLLLGLVLPRRTIGVQANPATSRFDGGGVREDQ